MVRITRRRARPDWSLPRALGWGTAAVLGDPAMLVLPLLIVAVTILTVLGLGAPGSAEVLVPALAAPPVDSFQDVGVVALAGHAGAGAWIARVTFALFRIGSFGLIAALAVARAHERSADTTVAAGALRRCARTLFGLGAVSFAFALLIGQQATLDATRDAGTAGTALLIGMLLFPGAVVAAVDGEHGVLRSFGRSARALVRHPVGHLALVAGYGAALGGLYRLATFGESGRPRAGALTAYAFLGGLLTAIFAATLARRSVVLAGAAGAAEAGPPVPRREPRPGPRAPEEPARPASARRLRRESLAAVRKKQAMRAKATRKG